MSTGKIWNGGEIPVIGDPMYMRSRVAMQRNRILRALNTKLNSILYIWKNIQMIFLIIPFFLVLISSIYYFLFFNRKIRNNIKWFALITVMFSVVFSVIFSVSERGSYDDFLLNFAQFTLLSSVYAFLLLGIHYFIIKKIRKILLVENYINYVIIFSFLSFFVTILYYLLIAFLFRLE